MRSSLRCAALAGLLLFGGGAALAQFGDPQTIGKEAVDLLRVRDQQSGEIIFSLKRYRGRVTVFYFWSTRNQESVRLLGTMNALDKTLRTKGVKFVDITPDMPERVNEAIRDKGVERLTDTVNFSGSGAWFVMNLFGAMSLPEIVVVDPDSRIIWRGSPNDRMEERLLAICELMQPLAGDPKRMAQRLRQSDKLLDQKEIGKAYTLARSVWMVTDDGTSERGDARAKMDKLESAAAEWLKEAIEAERAGDKDKAARIVSQIAIRFDDPDLRDEKAENEKDKDKLQIVKDAEAEIGRMNGDRALKAAIKAAQDQCQAEVLLEKAEQYEEVNRYDDALVTYRQVLKKYKDTPGAKTAQAGIDKIKNDKKLRLAVDKWRDAYEAARWLDIAHRCAKLELYDEAREYFERIVKEHPKSEEAKIAKEKLGKLPASPKETVEADSAAAPKAAKANTP